MEPSTSHSRHQDPLTYTIASFCREHHISRGYLYQLWAEGKGPRRIKVGRRTLISGEAAAAWRRRMERETPQLHAVDSSGA